MTGLIRHYIRCRFPFIQVMQSFEKDNLNNLHKTNCPRGVLNNYIKKCHDTWHKLRMKTTEGTHFELFGQLYKSNQLRIGILSLSLFVSDLFYSYLFFYHSWIHEPAQS